MELATISSNYCFALECKNSKNIFQGLEQDLFKYLMLAFTWLNLLEVLWSHILFKHLQSLDAPIQLIKYHTGTKSTTMTMREMAKIWQPKPISNENGFKNCMLIINWQRAWILTAAFWSSFPQFLYQLNQIDDEEKHDRSVQLPHTCLYTNVLVSIPVKYRIRKLEFRGISGDHLI